MTLFQFCLTVFFCSATYLAYMFGVWKEHKNVLAAYRRGAVDARTMVFYEQLEQVGYVTIERDATGLAKKIHFNIQNIPQETLDEILKNNSGAVPNVAEPNARSQSEDREVKHHPEDDPK